MHGVVGFSTSDVKSSLYSTEKIKLIRWVGGQEPAHHKVGSKLHPAPRGFSSRVGPTGLDSRRIAQGWLFIKTYYDPLGRLTHLWALIKVDDSS